MLKHFRSSDRRRREASVPWRANAESADQHEGHERGGAGCGDGHVRAAAVLGKWQALGVHAEKPVNRLASATPTRTEIDPSSRYRSWEIERVPIDADWNPTQIETHLFLDDVGVPRERGAPQSRSSVALGADHFGGLGSNSAPTLHLLLHRTTVVETHRRQTRRPADCRISNLFYPRRIDFCNVFAISC